jgi:hypothetical protein
MTTTAPTAPTVDRHGVTWILYRCTGCGRTELQRADMTVTCHRITEHPTPRAHRMRPTGEANR